MLLTAEKEDDIRLNGFRYNQPARPTQELHDNRNALSNASKLTRHGLSRCHHSSQTSLVGSRSIEYYDTFSLRLGQFRCDGDAAVPAREPSSAQQRASNDVNNDCAIFNTLSPSPSTGIEKAVLPFRNASNQQSRTFAHPQFFAGEIVPHTGKGKGRIPIVEQVPTVVQGSLVERDPSVDGTRHPYNPLQHLQCDRLLVTSSQHGKDTQLEHRQYQPKRFQHSRGESGEICKAVRPEKCKVYGNLLQKGAAIQHQAGSASRDSGHDASTNWFIVDESAEVRETVCDHDLTSLAEQAGQAAKKQKKIWSSVGPCEGLMFLFIFTLAIVAAAGGKHLA